jgi:hypothetical protein
VGMYQEFSISLLLFLASSMRFAREAALLVQRFALVKRISPTSNQSAVKIAERSSVVCAIHVNMKRRPIIPAFIVARELYILIVRRLGGGMRRIRSIGLAIFVRLHWPVKYI